MTHYDLLEIYKSTKRGMKNSNLFKITNDTLHTNVITSVERSNVQY